VQVCGWGLLAFSLSISALRSSPGPFLLLAALAVLLLSSRRAFLLGVTFAVPVSTIAWDMGITVIGGRLLDVRLLITFGVSALIGLALVAERPRLSRLEWLAALFVTWMIIIGLLRSDSVLTWAPPVARWFSYVGILILARRWTRDSTQVVALMAAIAIGFAVPAVLGLVQFGVGESGVLNGAVRATSPGGRGPIGLAFAGQMVLVLGFVLAEVRAERRRAWYGGAALGALAIVASATRIVTVTGWLALASLSATRRRWRMLGVVTIIFAVALAARPDLLGRFFGTVTSTVAPSLQPNESPDLSGGEALVLDPSLRFRLFVWETVLGEWVKQPMLGIGPGMTAAAVEAVAAVERTAPHNDYIGVLAELGVPGFTLFVALQGGLLISLIRRRAPASGQLRTMLPAAAALFVGVNVLGTLNNPTYFFDVQVSIWALVGSTIGAAGAVNRYA
jgi:O-antigen ligase